MAKLKPLPKSQTDNKIVIQKQDIRKQQWENTNKVNNNRRNTEPKTMAIPQSRTPSKTRRNILTRRITSTAALSILRLAGSHGNTIQDELPSSLEPLNNRNLIFRSLLKPKRRPIALDLEKRANVLPPDVNGGKKIQASSSSLQEPFYPSWDDGTCLSDHKYPEYYLYDINSFFFHSPEECCDKHFGYTADECLTAAISANAKNNGEAPAFKKEQYRSISMGSEGGARIGIPNGRKQPLPLKAQATPKKKKPLEKTSTKKESPATPAAKGDKPSGGKKPKADKEKPTGKTGEGEPSDDKPDSKGGKEKPPPPPPKDSKTGKSAKHSKSHGHGSKSVKSSKHSKSTSKTGKSGGKSAKATEEPTYFPTGIPTPISTTWYPTKLDDSYPPTSQPSDFDIIVTSEPSESGSSEMPTFSPTGVSFFPTYSTYEPTAGNETGVPTFSPTSGELPTMIPTPFVTLVPPKDLFVWGAPGSSGQSTSDYITMPLSTGVSAISAAAGSKYSIVIGPDGVASSAGVIGSMDDYYGHLGLRPQDLAEGQNDFQPISQVFDNDDGGVTDAPPFEKVFAGVENKPGSGIIHTVLLDRQGRAWVTGSNDNGQLCLGDEIDRLIPERIPIEGRIVDVAIGGEHTLLLDDKGNVYGCGSNKVGQLGLGESVSKTSLPTVLDLLPKVESISSGRDHSLFMGKDGIYATGSNEYGQLCSDTNGENMLSPSALELDVDTGKIMNFEAIKFSSFILYKDGSVSSCGKNDFGQLGDGTEEDQFFVEVQLEDTVRILGVGPSAESVFFVTADDSVWGTGLNDKGQLGIGDLLNRNIPEAVNFGRNVVIDILSAAEDHTIALGVVAGTFEPTPTLVTVSPTPVPTTLTPTISTILPTSIPATNSPTREKQGFFFWGAPEAVGQESPDVTQPLNVGDDAVGTAAGSGYSVIILQDGSALSGGFINSEGEYQGHLGLSSNKVSEGINNFQPIDQVYDPVEDDLVAAPTFDKVFAGVESSPGSGIIHTILVDRQGRAWATGSNSKGQLCLGDDSDRMVPERILIEGRIIDVAIGGEHTLLLDENGNVHGCGSNEVGQLGLGENIGTINATLVSGVDSVTSISAGLAHSLFIAEDGIYVTGANEYNQTCSDEIGDSTLLPIMLDVEVETVKSFEAIKFSSFILSTNGSVNSCGKNDVGQLGDGTEVDQILTTVQLDGVVRLVGGGPSAESAFFVTVDDSENDLVWGTGQNDRGQLGVGDLVNRNIPSRVKFETMVLLDTLSAAEDHTIALGLSGGTLSPTIAPTLITSSPTTYSQLCEDNDFFFWGAPESVGEVSSIDATRPLQLDGNVTYTSAGSRYSFVVLNDGNAVSAGFIESMGNYHGHLGLDLDDVSEGTNEFQAITQVFNNDVGEFVDAPRFEKAFAGVGGSSDPEAMHTILLDRQGQAWATGGNKQGQRE